MRSKFYKRSCCSNSDSFNTRVKRVLTQPAPESLRDVLLSRSSMQNVLFESESHQACVYSVPQSFLWIIVIYDFCIKL